MEDRYKKYYKQMWETKCARFNAHSRLSKLESRASSAIIVLTLTVVALSAFKAGAFFDLPDKMQKAGDLVLVLFAVILLVIELYVKGQRYGEIAKEFHKSGTEIARVYDSYVFEVNKSNPDDGELKGIINSYHDKIDGRSINHIYIDIQLVRAQHPDDYGIVKLYSVFYGLYVMIKCYVFSGGLYSLFAWASLIGTIATITQFAFGTHSIHQG